MGGFLIKKIEGKKINVFQNKFNLRLYIIHFYRVNMSIFYSSLMDACSENSRQQSCISVHDRQRPCLGSRRQQPHETDGGQLVLRIKVRNYVLLIYRRGDVIIVVCKSCCSSSLCLSFVFHLPLRSVILKSRQSLRWSCVTEARAWARGVFWCQSVTENRIHCN